MDGPHKARFADYVDYSLQEIAALYHLTLAEYADEDKYAKDSRQRIWDEINAENKMITSQYVSAV